MVVEKMAAATMSGRSEPATVVLSRVGKSAVEMDGILIVTPNSLLTCCQAGLFSSGVGAVLSDAVSALTSPPLPGGCGTDLISWPGSADSLAQAAHPAC